MLFPKKNHGEPFIPRSRPVWSCWVGTLSRFDACCWGADAPPFMGISWFNGDFKGIELRFSRDRTYITNTLWRYLSGKGRSRKIIWWFHGIMGIVMATINLIRAMVKRCILFMVIHLTMGILTMGILWHINPPWWLMTILQYEYIIQLLTRFRKSALTNYFFDHGTNMDN